MEIKQLVQEHLQEIFKDWIPSKDEEASAKSCASITLEHMKGFAEFIPKWKKEQIVKLNSDIAGNGSRDVIKDRWGYIVSITTEELIQLYFDSLNK